MILESLIIQKLIEYMVWKGKFMIEQMVFKLDLFNGNQPLNNLQQKKEDKIQIAETSARFNLVMPN